MHMLRTPATAVLIVVNLIVFFLMTAEGSGSFTPRFLVAWGGNFGRLTFHGEAWRLVTALFLHGSWQHIAGNMFCLFAWGSLTESALGTVRFVFAYFAFGLLANAASALVNPNIVSVGASGAIAGILGVMVVMWLKGDVRISAQGLLANIAINIVLSLLPTVDWVAHLAGFAAGVVIGALLFRGTLVRKAASEPATSD
jgi:rhomboid protease GluP